MLEYTFLMWPGFLAGGAIGGVTRGARGLLEDGLVMMRLLNRCSRSLNKRGRS